MYYKKKTMIGKKMNEQIKIYESPKIDSISRFTIFNLFSGCGCECKRTCLHSHIKPEQKVSFEKAFDTISEFHKKSRTTYNNSYSLTDLDIEHFCENDGFIDFINELQKLSHIALYFYTKSTPYEMLGIPIKRMHLGLTMVIDIMPEEIRKKLQPNRSSILERISFASLAYTHGYDIEFRFNPFLTYHNWEVEYMKILDLIRDIMPNKFADNDPLFYYEKDDFIIDILKDDFADDKIISPYLQESGNKVDYSVLSGLNKKIFKQTYVCIL